MHLSVAASTADVTHPLIPPFSKTCSPAAVEPEIAKKWYFN